MIVLKFGGTSVKDWDCIQKTLDIVEAQIERAPVMVSSAMARVTDLLFAIARSATDGDENRVNALMQEIRELHYSSVNRMADTHRSEVTAQLGPYFERLTSLVHGLLLLRECSMRTLDAIVSLGELLSTTIIAGCARERGINAELIDARCFMVTDELFNGATPLITKTEIMAGRSVRPAPGKVVITQGFIGSTESGATTTLGRGGSDYSATILGSALHAEEVQIWTDVNGIMTCDPRIVRNAKTIPTISYEEAAELAYFGAKVVHPSTIQPAVEKNIPVLVKNTQDPEGPFTTIVHGFTETGLRALAGKKGITLIGINSSRMLNAYGFLSRIFSIFERYQTPVDLIATSEVSVSVTIDSTASLTAIVEELTEIAHVTVEEEKAIICLVGKDLWKNPVFVAEVFNTMKNTPLRMISLGSTDINLSVVVPESDMAETLSTLHERFLASG